MVVRAFLEAWERDGGSRRSLLEACPIDLPDLFDVLGSVPRSTFLRLLRAAASLAREPKLGLRLGAAVGTTALHLVGHVLMASPTLREGVQTLIQLQPAALGGPRLRWFVCDGDRVGFGFEVEAHPDAQVEADFMWAWLVSGLRPLCAAGCFDDAWEAEQGYSRRMVVLPKAALDAPRPGVDRELFRTLHQMAVDRFVHPDRSETWTNLVRRALRGHEDLAHLELGDVAKKWGATHRVLRRRLSEEGVGFRQLIEEARMERACVQLARQSTSIGHIAQGLGYSETSSFHRAFRRWTGETPSDYRRRARTAGPSPSVGAERGAALQSCSD